MFKIQECPKIRKSLENKVRFTHFSLIQVPYRFQIRDILDKAGNDLSVLPYIIHINLGDEEIYKDQKVFAREEQRVEAFVKKCIAQYAPNFHNETIVFQTGDYKFCTPSLQRFVVFQESVSRNNMHSMAMPFNSDYSLPVKPIEESVYLASFQGNPINSVRRDIHRILSSHKDCKSHITQKFFYRYNEEEQDNLRKSYFENIDKSKFVFCPKGLGQNSIRFFETLSRGRVPILISDDVRLPLENLIDYSEFCVIGMPSIEQLRELDAKKMGLKALEIYRTYFERSVFPDFLLHSLRSRAFF